MSSAPVVITGSTPKRLIRWPVKKLGTNIASTWASSTRAAALNGCWHCCMAIGVAAISRFITP